MGQARLDFYFKELEKIIAKAEARALNPTNKIINIKVAIIGFSRGATLARAFVRDLLDTRQSRTILKGDQTFWKKGRYPLSVEFMGLWDSVASVGLPMSANNVRAIRSSRRVGANVGRFAADALLQDRPELLRAVDLAFGVPGADPSPGSANGHGAWADGLGIPAAVRQCVQMVAAHEIRNSFPVDSLQRGGNRAANCKEMVYPGSHSDVGGGYRPGEGGKGSSAASGTGGRQLTAELLSQLALKAMYDEAVAAGVPMRKTAAANWLQDNANDFEISPAMADIFNHYMNQAGWGGRPLEQMILSHTRQFFAWRWYRVANGRLAEMSRLQRNETIFAGDRAALNKQKQSLELKRLVAQRQADSAQMQRDASIQGQWMNPNVDVNAIRSSTARYDEQIAAANAEVQRTDAQLKELQARLDGAANDGELAEHLSEYDAELRNDALSILASSIKILPGATNCAPTTGT